MNKIIVFNSMVLRGKIFTRKEKIAFFNILISISIHKYRLQYFNLSRIPFSLGIFDFYCISIIYQSVDSPSLLIISISKSGGSP